MYHTPALAFSNGSTISISQARNGRKWMVACRGLCVVLLTSHDIDIHDIILCFKTIIHNHCRPVPNSWASFGTWFQIDVFYTYQNELFPLPVVFHGSRASKEYVIRRSSMQHIFKIRNLVILPIISALLARLTRTRPCLRNSQNGFCGYLSGFCGYLSVRHFLYSGIFACSSTLKREQVNSFPSLCYLDMSLHECKQKLQAWLTGLP